MTAQRIKLFHGPTGLEAQTPDGALVGHVCHSDQVGDVLDMLREQFPGEFEVWATGATTENTNQPPCEVLATPFELLRAASGNPITVSTVDGEEVVLRIPTLEEYKAAVARSHEWFTAHGLEVPEAPSDDAILAAIKPLPL